MAQTEHADEPSAEAVARLTTALGAPPPPGIAALDADVLDELAGAITEARTAQQRQLADAFDHALRIVPRPLRRVVRKVVEG